MLCVAGISEWQAWWASAPWGGAGPAFAIVREWGGVDDSRVGRLVRCGRQPTSSAALTGSASAAPSRSRSTRYAKTYMRWRAPPASNRRLMNQCRRDRIRHPRQPAAQGAVDMLASADRRTARAIRHRMVAIVGRSWRSPLVIALGTAGRIILDARSRDQYVEGTLRRPC